MAAAQRALHRIVEPHRAPLLYGGVMTQLAESQIALGQWADADRTLHRCGETVDDDAEKAQVLALAGLLACWREHLDEAAALLERVEAAPTHMPEASDRVRPRWLAAELAAARHELDGVRETVDLCPYVERTPGGGRLDHLWQPLLLELRLETEVLVRTAARPGIRHAPASSSAGRPQRGSTGSATPGWPGTSTCRRKRNLLRLDRPRSLGGHVHGVGADRPGRRGRLGAAAAGRLSRGEPPARPCAGPGREGS